MGLAQHFGQQTPQRLAFQSIALIIQNQQHRGMCSAPARSLISQKFLFESWNKCSKTSKTNRSQILFGRFAIHSSKVHHFQLFEQPFKVLQLPNGAACLTHRVSAVSFKKALPLPGITANQGFLEDSTLLRFLARVPKISSKDTKTSWLLNLEF